MARRSSLSSSSAIGFALADGFHCSFERSLSQDIKGPCCCAVYSSSGRKRSPRSQGGVPERQEKNRGWEIAYHSISSSSQEPPRQKATFSLAPVMIFEVASLDCQKITSANFLRSYTMMRVKAERFCA